MLEDYAAVVAGPRGRGS